MANFNDLLPVAPAGGINVKWQKDTGGNISAYYSTAGAQTPWTQDIDAATWGLFRVGAIRLIGPPHIDAGAAGVGLEIFGDGTIGQVQSYDRTAGAYAPLHLTGHPVRLVHDAMLVAETQPDGTLSANLSAATKALVQTPWTQDIDGAGFKLSNVGNIQSPTHASIGHSFNLTWDGSVFKYVAAQAGFVLRSDSAFRVLGAPSGAAGAAATLTELFTVSKDIIGIRSDQITHLPYTAGSGSYVYMANSAATPRFAINITNDAAANDFQIIRYDNAGTFIEAAFHISRSTGTVSIGRYLSLVTRTAAVDDAAAAAAGVPVGGLYHNAGAVRVRLA